MRNGYRLNQERPNPQLQRPGLRASLSRKPLAGTLKGKSLAKVDEKALYLGLPRKSWARVAVLVGIGYALAGIVFAIPTTHVRAWRLAAWAISAAVFAAHIAYERFRLHNPPGSAALHVSVAAALGAFGLAVGANIHSLSTGSANHSRSLLLLALGIWPVITALPAFLVALVANLALARVLGKPARQVAE